MRDAETIIVTLDQQPFASFDLAAKMRDFLTNESEHHYRVDLFDADNESAGFIIIRTPKQQKTHGPSLDIKNSKKSKQENQNSQHEPEPSSKITINKIYHPALRTYFLYIPLAIVGLFLVFFAVELWLFVLSMLGMKELPTWVDGGLLVIGTQIVGSTWVGRLMLIVLINYYGTALLIDSHGLTLKQGVLTRDVTHIRFSEIRTIGLRQGLLDRLLNIGILEFASSGTDDVDIRFINIANPTGVKAKIEAIIEQQIQGQ